MLQRFVSHFLLGFRVQQREMEIKSTVVVAGGKLIRFSHQSAETGTPMTCSVFLPVAPEDAPPASQPYIVYLSGLTCTDENVCQKSGVFNKLAELKVSKRDYKALWVQTVLTFTYFYDAGCICCS
jgi:S-formylglutathione hydrolase FrmB